VLLAFQVVEALLRTVLLDERVDVPGEDGVLSSSDFLLVVRVHPRVDRFRRDLLGSLPREQDEREGDGLLPDQFEKLQAVRVPIS